MRREPVLERCVQEPVPFHVFVVGGVLLSHILPGAVPSALGGLASGFGMGPGVSQPLSPPTRRVRAVLKNICLACVVCLILHSEQRVI